MLAILLLCSRFQISVLLKPFWSEAQNHILYCYFKSCGSIGSSYHLWRARRHEKSGIWLPPYSPTPQLKFRHCYVIKSPYMIRICSQDFKTLYPKDVLKEVEGAELVSLPHHHRRPGCTHIIAVLVFKLLYITILHEIVHSKKPLTFCQNSILPCNEVV